jgi:hypothetical protein
MTVRRKAPRVERSLGKSKKIPEHENIALIVGHFRQMLFARDGFSVLVRGMVLLDQGLDMLLDARLVVPLKKVKDVVSPLTLNGKMALALAIGVLSEAEYGFIRECNGLRNRVAHRMNVAVTEAEEKSIVALYNKKMKNVISGDLPVGDEFPYPQPLAIAFILAATRLRFRASYLKRLRFDLKESEKDDVASFGFATAMMRLARDGGELEEDRVKATVLAYVRTYAAGKLIVKARERGATYEEAVESLKHPRPRIRRRYPLKQM